MRVHRVEDDRGDQEVEAVFEEVVDRHRHDAEDGARPDDRPGEEGADGDADKRVLRAPAAAVRDETHEKEESGADAGDEHDGEQRQRSLYAPPADGRARGNRNHAIEP